MEKSPRISILMSTFNEEKHIRQAIDSLLSQTYKDFELIVVDDKSTDNTFAILQEYAKKDSRVIPIENEENIGFCRSLNIGLSLAKGEYIARADGDDISLPNRLQIEIDFMDSHQEYDGVGSSYLLFDDNGIWGFRYRTGEGTIQGALKMVPISHPTVLLRYAALKDVDFYTVWKKKTRCSEDYDLWLKMLSNGHRLTNIEQPLILYREDSISYAKRDKAQQKFLINLKKSWRKKLHKQSFDSSIIKDSLVGLLPRKLYRKVHQRKLRESLEEHKDLIPEELRK